VALLAREWFERHFKPAAARAAGARAPETN
jgi:hypothetical protein